MLIKNCVPPLFFDFYKNHDSKSVRWAGNYPSWVQALEHCKGYSENSILEKVKNATQQVVEGKALFERDSVLFYEPEFSWEIISILLKIGIENNNTLSVLDFGGALGSVYFQNRSFLEVLTQLKWHIVEQQNYVDCGKKYFERKHFNFYHSIQECLVNQQPNVLLLSSVLQYLDQPFQWINQFLDSNIEYILVDRTAFISGEKNRLTVQQIPEKIYAASYPAWFFNEEKFIKAFQEKYQLMIHFDTFLEPTKFLGLQKAYWKGFLFKRKIN